MGLELILFHLSLLGITLLLSLSLSVVWRSGLLSLGHQGFFAAGAYAGALVLKIMAEPGSRGSGGPAFVLSVLSGAAVAGVAGLAVARLTARLRDDYFTVATLIVAEIVQNVLANVDALGGAQGFEAPRALLAAGAVSLIGEASIFAALVVGAAAALYVTVQRLDRSVYGLYITAGSDDDLATMMTGIDTAGVRRVMFTAAAGVAGLAGALFLHLTKVITPADFGFVGSIPVILGVVLGRGGNARCFGATALVYVAYEIIKLRCFGLLGDDVGDLIGSWKDALLALALLAAVHAPGWLSRRLGRATKEGSGG